MSRVDRASKTIRASANRIYQALTSEAELAEWLAPKGMTGKIENFELRQEGGYRLTLSYDDPASEAAGKTNSKTDVVDVTFAKVVPDREIVEVATFRSDDPAFAGAMTMTWTMRPMGDATEVEIVCEDVPIGIKHEDHAAGLKSSLDNLAAHVEARS